MSARTWDILLKLLVVPVLLYGTYNVYYGAVLNDNNALGFGLLFVTSSVFVGFDFVWARYVWLVKMMIVLALLVYLVGIPIASEGWPFASIVENTVFMLRYIIFVSYLAFVLFVHRVVAKRKKMEIEDAVYMQRYLNNS